MAVKHKYVVSIVLSDKQMEKWGTLVECLRYAGSLSRVEDPMHKDGDRVWDLVCPHRPSDINSEVWAQQNADRMKSFGINAVKAPAKW